MEQPGISLGDALIVVDVKRDFLPGGAPGVPAGDEVVGPGVRFAEIVFDTALAEELGRMER